MNIQVNTFPLFAQLNTGYSQELPVLFRIKAGEMPTTTEKRVLNLAIVLDRSGSMEGDSLENCKKAIIKLMDLLGPNDKLHFVTYDDEIETIFEDASGPDLKANQELVQMVNAGRFTNLFAGAERGAQLVAKHHQDNVIDAVFLFSDGQANEGIQDIEEIGQEIGKIHKRDEIRFTTIGIGSDFNEKLMSSIARISGGNYFFIDDVERIPSIVDKAYHGLANIIAKDLNLKIRGLGDCAVTELEGCQDIGSGKHWSMIRENGIYQVLAKAMVIPRDQKILQWQLTFTDLQTGKPVTTTGEVSINLIDGFVISEQTPSPQVVVYQTFLKCAELNELANQAMKKRKTSEAIKYKEQIITKYEQVLALDDINFIQALLEKERSALRTLKRDGLTPRSVKICSYTTPSLTDRLRCETNETNDQDIAYYITS